MNAAINLKRFTSLPSALIFLTIVLAGLVVASLAIGAFTVPPTDILRVFGHQLGLVPAVDGTYELVLMDIRLPRVILTLLVGAALGLSGAVLQGLFRNPLVEPGIIGVSNGAALGAVVMIIFISQIAPVLMDRLQTWLLPLFAFGGALLATMFTIRLSRLGGKTEITYLILAGVAITALTGAAIGLAIFYADDQQLRSFTFWTLGDLSVATWDKLHILLPLILFACIGLLTLASPLNAIALGESEAYHSGVNVERTKIVAIVLTTLAVGTAVAFTGVIGFVGLVVPHIIRISFTSDNRLVLPASAIGGAALLILADIVARTIVSPAELPIGVVTAIIGTPFFIYLLITTKKKKLI
jgi:iron complex transport system permease protein